MELRKNYIYRLAYEILVFLLPLITVPYISRVLGADGVGRFSFVDSVTSYFVMFCALGKQVYGTRRIAIARNDREAYSKLFWEIELMSLLCFAVCMVPWAVLTFSSRENRLLYMLMTPFLLAALADISWFYTGLEHMGIIAGINSLVKTAGVVILLLVIKGHEDVPLYCAVNALVLFVSNMLMWLFLPRFLCRVRQRLSIREHLKESLVYFIPAVATSVYLVLDKTLIGLICGDAYENGYYEQASKLLAMAKSFSFLVFNSVMSARMSYVFSTEKDEKIKEMVGWSMDFILLFGYAAVCGLAGISNRLVPALFGEGYEPVEGLIYLMLPLVLIIGVSNCLECNYYIPVGQRSKTNKYLITGAVTNLIMNLCLIPRFGAKGAVAASIIAELLITVLYMHNCGGVLNIKQIWNCSLKRIPAGICMAVIVFVTGRLPYNSICVLMAQLAAGAFSYVLILLILKDRMLIELLHFRT